MNILVQFKTFLSMFHKFYILSHHFIIQLNYNIIFLFLSCSTYWKNILFHSKDIFLLSDKFYIN